MKEDHTIPMLKYFCALGVLYGTVAITPAMALFFIIIIPLLIEPYINKPDYRNVVFLDKVRKER